MCVCHARGRDSFSHRGSSLLEKTGGSIDRPDRVSLSLSYRGDSAERMNYFDRVSVVSECTLRIYLDARRVKTIRVRLFLRLRGEFGFGLRTSTEDLAASIATAGELGVVAVAAVDLVHLATELLVHQGHSAPVAEEARLVPVLILVRQVLRTIRRPIIVCSFSRLTEVVSRRLGFV